MATVQEMVERFERVDTRLTKWMASVGLLLLRMSLGVVYFWFGVLKFFPGLSPAEGLATRTIEVMTFGLMPPEISLPILATWECLIGLGLLTGRYMRVTLLLLFAQMVGTVSPIFFFPGDTFTVVPIAPTLEGQYIIKNIVLASAGIVIGATVRGGYLESTPQPAHRPKYDDPGQSSLGVHPSSM